MTQTLQAASNLIKKLQIAAENFLSGGNVIEFFAETNDGKGEWRIYRTCNKRGYSKIYISLLLPDEDGLDTNILKIGSNKTAYFVGENKKDLTDPIQEEKAQKLLMQGIFYFACYVAGQLPDGELKNAYIEFAKEANSNSQHIVKLDEFAALHQKAGELYSITSGNEGIKQRNFEKFAASLLGISTKPLP